MQPFRPLQGTASGVWISFAASRRAPDPLGDGSDGPMPLTDHRLCEPAWCSGWPGTLPVVQRVVSAVPTLPRYLSRDQDPLFEFHRWKANLHVLEVKEIKTLPYVPLSHLFVERLFATTRQESLAIVPFWTARDLERKLVVFREYYNGVCVHRALEVLHPTSGPRPETKTAPAWTTIGGRAIVAGCTSYRLLRDPPLLTEMSPTSADFRPDLSIRHP